MAETTYNVGIYCRLSNDDERDGESVSIENQNFFFSSMSMTGAGMRLMCILMTVSLEQTSSVPVSSV